jgi:hypothetical protein
MLVMVIEKFRDTDAVYRRAAERGRMLPDGLEYVDSWIDTVGERCFQLMRYSDPALFDEWAGHWNDLVDFEFVPVISSAEMSARLR